MAKEPGVLYYIPTLGGRRNEFMPFQKALPQSEKQRDLSRIWTRVADYFLQQ